MHAFARRLRQGPLLCDGGMGSFLYARGVELDPCFDALNLSQPRLVQSVHTEYIAVGTDAIETNTFGANRFKLAAFGLDGDVRRINAQGARIARDARESSGRDVFVLGSIGPLGRYLAPLGTVTPDEELEAFREQVGALVAGGGDALIAETFSGVTEITLAVQAIRSVTDLPVLASMTFTEECVTFAGRAPAEVAQVLRKLYVDAMGANCSVGSSVLFEILEQMVPEAGGIPLSIQP